MTTKEGELILNFEDDIISGACMAHNGEILCQRVKDALGVAVTQ
jgi:NAD(P) transhydrogenase subunit alpha